MESKEIFIEYLKGLKSAMKHDLSYTKAINDVLDRLDKIKSYKLYNLDGDIYMIPVDEFDDFLNCLQHQYFETKIDNYYIKYLINDLNNVKFSLISE